MYSLSVHPNTRDFEKHWLYISDYAVQTPRTLDELALLLKRHTWCHSLFLGGRRGSDKFLTTNMLVLDYDNGYTIELAKLDFKEYRYVIGTTKSHRVFKNERSCDRFRVVLFFDDFISDPIQAKQNFYDFITNYNKTIKQTMHKRIEAYCQATHQNFKNWQAVDIGSSDIARKWLPFTEIIEIKQQGKTIPIAPKVQVEFNGVNKDMANAKFRYFNNLSIPRDGRSYTLQCPVCLSEGGDLKGQNLSVRFSEGQYFFRCNKNATHKIRF